MLASPPPHTAFTRRIVGVATLIVIGVVTITLLMRGEIFTITGEGSGAAAGAGTGVFGGTPLTGEAAGAGVCAGAGAGAGAGAASGISVRGNSEIISPSLETLALRLKDESPGIVSVMSPDIVLNP